MTTDIKSNEISTIAINHQTATVSTVDVFDDGTPIETWAETVASENRVIVKGEVTAHLQELETRRLAIDEGVMRRANTALYNLLADCLAVATLAAQLDPDNVRAREIDAFLEARKLKPGKDEPLFSKVITAVFGKLHPSRIGSYRTTLKAACAAGVTATQLPSWIESQGGIQEIRLTAQGNGRDQTAEMSSLALDYLRDKGGVYALQCDAILKQLTIESNGKEVVLVATKQRDGTLVIHTAIEDPSCVQKAIDSFQRKNQEAIKEFKYELKYRPGMRAA